MNRKFYILVLGASLALPAFSPAFATITSSTSQIKQIQESRERQLYGRGAQDSFDEGLMTGRSATEAPPPRDRFPATPMNEEDQMRVLEGVDPAAE